jgi:hypothetical protein
MRTYYILLLLITQSACSSTSFFLSPKNEKPTKSLKSHDNFLASGSITLSFPVNTDLVSGSSIATTEKEDYNSQELPSSGPASTDPRLRYAPVIGFFPPVANFNPADNELWIQIDSTSRELKVFKGKEQIKSVTGEGQISLAPGEYPLQHKQKDPLWYAPDQYFEKRRLRVPPRGDNFRYRRGALGTYAIYPTTSFPIHSGPIWSEEVGGFKISETDLASIFTMIQPGTPVIVK